MSRIGFPPLSIAIGPKTLDDAVRLARGLERLTADDPVLRAETDEVTGEVVLSGISEMHLEIVIDRLKREFDVEATCGRPRIGYKETITRPADGEAKHVTPEEGGRQYAHVKLRLIPGEPGTGCIVANQIMGGVIPDRFIASIDEGVCEALAHGVLAGYPVDDVLIELHDGSYHDVDSSEAAFRIAGFLAFQNAAKHAGPVLLEPIMRVEVIASEEYAGEIVANLSSRRGQIHSTELRGSTRLVIAHVPLADMFGYSTDLRSRTFGRGSYTMQLEGYQPHRPADGDEEGRDSLVREPRGPAPRRRDARIALPEPDDDGPI